ncbi:MAG TPA: hypothetical protein DDY22_07520 [Geobacter sp.]|nr:hypothetical protein [Geobacter sp.]
MSKIDEARESLKKAMGGRHGALHHGAEVSISVSGRTAEMKVISVIEDLKEDTDYFIACAKSEQNILQRKRFVRAGFLTLNAYIEASVNQLYSAMLLDAGVSDSEIETKLRFDKFHDKCKALERKCIPGSRISKKERTKLRSVRNDLVHFKTGHLDLWHRLSLEDLESFCSKHKAWLGELRRNHAVQEPNTDDVSKFIKALSAALGVKMEVAEGIA